MLGEAGGPGHGAVPDARGEERDFFERGVPWSRIEGIAWAGDDLGLRLSAGGEDPIGDTLLVSWSGLLQPERRRLRRAIETRVAEHGAT